jgi:two-component system chemotaxis response regulator CheB
MVRLTRSAVRSHGTNGHIGDQRRSGPPAVIGIGASTGGPTALRTVLGALPADFPVPVLVVQHMVAGFNQGLAAWLSDTISLPVSLAVAGRGLTAGVCIAPDEAHLVVSAAGRIQLDTRTPGNPHRPSADMLLQSLARTYGARVIAVVLTGMGVDGAAGVQSVIAAGGEAITEPAGAATLWAMPAAAAAAGATVVGLDAIGLELVSAAARR